MHTQIALVARIAWLNASAAVTQIHAPLGGSSAVALAVLLTAASFWALAGIERLSAEAMTEQHTHRLAPMRRAEITRIALLAQAINHVGGGFVAATAIRAKLYMQRGWLARDIAQTAMLVTSAIWSGALVAAVVAIVYTGPSALLVVHPLFVYLRIHAGAASVLGGVIAAIVAGVLLRGGSATAHIHPSISLSGYLRQVALATFDWGCCAGVLYVFLPQGRVPFALCVAVFVFAHVAGAMTYVPAGVGVFEVTIMALLAPLAGTWETAGAIIWYRVVYYGVPLFAAGMAIAVPSVRRRWSQFRTASEPKSLVSESPDTPPLTPDVGARVAALVAAAASTTAHLALVGDKRVLFSADRHAFLMYGISGRSWVAMGDPVGTPTEQAALIHTFCRMAAAHGGRPAFYHATPAALPIYEAAGLIPRKIGECAHVALANFAPDRKLPRWMRKSRTRAMKAGCSVDVLAPAQVAPLISELRRVSDQWLEHKGSREKCFSLGYFDTAYLQRCPVAIVRQGEQIVAFANIWLSGGYEEASVDLMRYTPDAPDGTIDLLMCEILRWAFAQQYQWFDLGVAPLAGLSHGRGAPLWNRVGHWIFHHGNRVYRFMGLYQYKSKYAPTWTARYVVLPHRLSAVSVLADIARLICGGARPHSYRALAATDQGAEIHTWIRTWPPGATGHATSHPDLHPVYSAAGDDRYLATEAH